MTAVTITMTTTTTAKNQTTGLNFEQHDNYELTTLRTTVPTTGDAKLSSVPLAPVLQTTTKIGFSRNAVSGHKEGVDFGNIMADSLEYLKKMLGLTPDCLNGGMKTLRGECICPKFYRGNLCEELVCINNGTLVKIPKLVPAQYACKCPHPEFIHGAHCELVKCLNGGRPMDNGHCKCLDYWYTGQFCQEYTASWGAVLGLPLVCMVIIIICCVVCRLDLFPRKPAHARRRRRAPTVGMCGDNIDRRYRGPEIRRENNRRGNEICLRTQENLLNDNNCEPALILRPYRSAVPSYIIRLDRMAAFNPTLPANSNSRKPRDPPPSYEQALAATSSAPQPANAEATGVLPPEYTPYAPPPPPRFRPPDLPGSSS